MIEKGKPGWTADMHTRHASSGKHEPLSLPCTSCSHLSHCTFVQRPQSTFHQPDAVCTFPYFLTSGNGRRRSYRLCTRPFTKVPAFRIRSQNHDPPGEISGCDLPFCTGIPRNQKSREDLAITDARKEEDTAQDARVSKSAKILREVKGWSKAHPKATPVEIEDGVH